MNITIRRAEEADIKTVQEFGSKLLNFERENYDPSLDGSWALSDEAKAKYLDAIQNKYVVVAESDGQPVGFLIGNILAQKAGDARQIKQAYLQNLYVDADFRKGGVGKELVEDFKNYCRNEGVKRLNVSVLAANETAVKFYSTVGFEPRSLSLSQEL